MHGPNIFSITQISSTTFTALPCKACTIQYKDTLGAGSWTTLQTYSSTPVQQTITFADTTATNTRFYRITTP